MTAAAPTAVLADDEPALLDYLREQLRAAWPALRIVGTAPHGHEALRLVDALDPDVLFLDIRMPGLGGLDVAARLAGTAHAPEIVFVTAHDAHAIEAFEREAVDYLLKPPTRERLGRTVDKLQRRLALRDAARHAAAGGTPPRIDADARREDPAALLARLAAALGSPGAAPASAPRLDWIRAAEGDGTRLVSIDEVVYFEARDKYVSVFTATGEHLIRLSLKELLDGLDPARFWQVHRSTIVAVRHIAGTTRDLRGRTHVTLKTRPEKLPVSRAYAGLFRQM